MNEYIQNLKDSEEFRNKMLIPGKRGIFQGVYINFDNFDLMWDGWDPVYEVVSVIKTIKTDNKVEKQKFIAVFNMVTKQYFAIPGRIAKEEGF